LLLIIIGIILSLIVCYGPIDNWRWDPSFYYAQLRSPIVEHDLDFRDETIPRDGVPFKTVTGLQPSQWPVGPGILWSPFFLLAHLYKLTVFGSQEATGFTPAYIALVSAGSSLYGLLGVFVIYRTCRIFATSDVSLMTALLVLMSTPLFFYIYRQPIMAHSSSLLAAALLLYAIVMILQEKIPLQQSGLIIGALVGLNTILRWLGAASTLLAMMLFLTMMIDAARQRNWQTVRDIMMQAGISGIIALLVFLPQMALWYQFHLAWVVTPISGFSSSYAPLYLVDLFIHTNRGILFWSPFILVGLIGLAWLPYPRLHIILLPYLLGYLYVLSSWEKWHGGGGFGPRFFIELLPVVAIGFASLAQKFWQDWRGKSLLLIGSTGLIIHQFALVTMVEQIWLPLQAYFDGEPVPIHYHMQALSRLISEPGHFFQPRPHIGVDRQTILVNVLAQRTDIHAYLIPITAILLIPAGILWYTCIEKHQYLHLVAVLITGYMVGWFCFLLML
jgi:hypothetical protein